MLNTDRLSPTTPARDGAAFTFIPFMECMEFMEFIEFIPFIAILDTTLETLAVFPVLDEREGTTEGIAMRAGGKRVAVATVGDARWNVNAVDVGLGAKVLISKQR